MSWKTPGVVLLTRWFFSFVIPIVGLFIAVSRIFSLYHLSLSSWAISAFLFGGTPIVFTVYLAWTQRSHRRRAMIMGARAVPRVQGKWIGNMDVLIELVTKGDDDYIGQVMHEHMVAYGPTINLNILWEDVIMTAEPNHIKTILATDFNNYEKGEKFRDTARSVLGTGVFNSDGETWKFHRTMTRPFFNRDRISHFDIFDRHANKTVSLMKDRFNSGHAIDFQDVISRFTLDSATEFLFGHSVDTLFSGLPYPYDVNKTKLQDNSSSERFARAFKDAQRNVARRNTVGQTWPLLELFADRTAEPMQVVNAFLEPILKEAIQKHQSSFDADKDAFLDEETLLEHLVRQTTDITLLKDEVLNILLAGRDTTASTLTSAIYLLALHPPALARLREEILAKIGPSRRPTYDDIRDMKYLRAVLNETLRLFPAVPFNLRESINDTTWSSLNPHEKPLFIPARTTVAYSVLLMHRRPDLWGPDANEFDPDRFLDDRLKKYLTPNPFIFLPFNAGPRICLGQQFAYNEMSFMLIRLLQNFSSITLDLEARSPESRPPAEWATAGGRKGIEKFRPKAYLTIYSMGGMWVKMEEAQSAKSC
ncbi:hypothetical protein SERLA73DRAFT_163545 [Serpula lacrymans var. lacrymans S7.3]|uniref:Cytochrome P450 monooxygenase pc-3 n=2 Tax=Serpula lacrymans var. lacrymans TaxID=341189 RepID=F8QED2_SERL3|nr:uncharacterized protein SERLADRAFT_418770 [Serpula lacrymans var. lacrymans S7.9]EGN93507.1 hypothetical protein SERLA73DRAFT_163545 [Serpula lacrymans var. lacrymans S7.3]EGO18886.1 hypothetical protein SERLADRAFT_418770 [Serpula lacrymans var. lacrymans S7.9]